MTIDQPAGQSRHGLRLTRMFFYLLLISLAAEALFLAGVYLFYGVFVFVKFGFASIFFFLFFGMGWFPELIYVYVPKRPRWRFWLLTIAIGLSVAALIYLGFDLANYRPPLRGVTHYAPGRNAAPLMTMLFGIGYIAGIWTNRKAF